MSKINYKHPFRVGRKQNRVILDADGKKVVEFPIGCSGMAIEYVDFLNAKNGSLNYLLAERNNLVEVGPNVWIKKNAPQTTTHRYKLTVLGFERINNKLIFHNEPSTIWRKLFPKWFLD